MIRPWLCCLLALTCLCASGATTKKVIQAGWGTPLPSDVAQSITQMERQPFDGLVMKLRDEVDIFSHDRWTDEELEKENLALQQISSARLTDNFLLMRSTSHMDWFSDDDWAVITDNVATLARAAHQGRCIGLVFDTEPYGASPWRYAEQPQATTKRFAEYQAIVRTRGAQFMQAMQREYPEITILAYWLLTPCADAITKDAAIDLHILEAHEYGLLPSFVNGMLDAARPGVTIIDGNEASYWYTTTEEFAAARQAILKSNAVLIAAENQEKYRQHVRCAHALYVDYIFNLLPTTFPVPMYSAYLSPAARARWFEHNLYYALQNADDYVWVYGEHLNWWTKTDVPAGSTAAIESAKRKYTDQQPLGFTITTAMNAARAHFQ